LAKFVSKTVTKKCQLYFALATLGNNDKNRIFSICVVSPKVVKASKASILHPGKLHQYGLIAVNLAKPKAAAEVKLLFSST
jgi:hypothetical protein